MLEVVPKQVSWVLSASITMFRRASNMGICGYSKYRLAKNSCTACVAQWYLQKVQTTQKSQYPCVIYKLQLKYKYLTQDKTYRICNGKRKKQYCSDEVCKGTKLQLDSTSLHIYSTKNNMLSSSGHKLATTTPRKI